MKNCIIKYIKEGLQVLASLIIAMGAMILIISFHPSQLLIVVLIRIAVGIAAYFLIYFYLLSKIDNKFELYSKDALEL